MTRILIVDDKEENLAFLQSLLTSGDCTVNSAHDGAEALQMARQSPPDLVISDLLMPVMDGYALLRHWKADALLKKAPFIIYTATYTDPEDERLALSMGADAFMLKPADPVDLLARVRAVLANAALNAPAVAKESLGNGHTTLKAYNEALIRKLETKTLQLEESNRALRREATERKKAQKSLRLLGAALEQANESIMITEAQLDRPGPRIVSVNPAYTHMTGYTAEESIGKTPRILQGPGTDRAVLRRLRENLEHGEVFSGEAINYRKDGTPFDLEWQIAPVRASDGEITHFIAIQRDVTERNRMEEALRTSVKEFRDLAEAMPQIVWITRADGWNTYFNQQWMDYTGLTLEESMGHGWNKPFHPDDQRRAWEAWQKATAKAGVYSLEARLRRADGTYRWWLIRGVPLQDASGGVVKWFGTCTDIDDLKASELEVFRANRALKMLSDCNQTLNRAEAEPELLGKICRVAVETGGYRMAWVGFLQDGEEGLIEPAAHAGVEEGYLSEVNSAWKANHPRQERPAGKCVRTGRAVVIDDILQDASFTLWLPLARQRGYRGVVCLPLIEDNRAVGVLGLFSSEVIPTSAQELKLMQEMADNLAYGICRLRDQALRRRMEAAVVKVAAAVSAATGTEFFVELARNMAEALGAHSAFVLELLPGDPPSARAVVAVVNGEVAESFEYALEGTPCENLADSETCVVAKRVLEQFPRAERLAALDVQAYAGQRLNLSTGQQIGHLCVLFREPLQHVEFVTSALQIFAARAASEMERRQTDTQVREQAALLDSANDAIYVKDLEDRIIYWNKGAEKTFGWSAAEIVGRKSGEILYQDQATFENAQTALFATGVWKGEMVKRTKDGRDLPVDVHCTLVRDAAGRPKSSLAINTDITARKRAEKELAESRKITLLELERLVAERTQALYAATQEAERANRAKSEFLSRMSHELRTPLHAVLGFAQIMEMEDRSPEDAEGLAQITRAGNHLLGLINEVLDIAQVEAGGLALTPEPVNVRATLEEALSLVKPQAAKRGVRLQWLSSAADCAVLSSEQRLKQVMLNLLSNAVKYNREGGSVVVSLTKIGDCVRVEIADTGRGITAENVGKLFVPFERLDAGDQAIEGTGLGLSLSKLLVEGMGGRIGVASKLGEGTTFWVELPLTEAPPPPASRKPATAKSSVVELPPPTAPRTVLYIEDNPANSRLVERILARRPEVKLISATEGVAGLELASQHLPELVLVDLQLPGIQGDEILRRLRADPRTALLRIVIISADATPAQIARLRELGANDYLTKPIDMRKFLALVDALEPRGAESISAPGE